jgi:ribonuclease HI
MKQIIAYCDGGSRGNPGPSAWAFAVYNGDELVHSESKYLGDHHTNNEAEYAGLIALLQFLHGKNVRVLIFCDSELVVNQVNEEWACINEKLKPMCAYAQGLKARGQHTLQHCKGHDGILGNEYVDQLVNECLDKREYEELMSPYKCDCKAKDCPQCQGWDNNV